MTERPPLLPGADFGVGVGRIPRGNPDWPAGWYVTLVRPDGPVPLGPRFPNRRSAVAAAEVVSAWLKDDYGVTEVRP
jgi:hypothetical protein